MQPRHIGKHTATAVGVALLILCSTQMASSASSAPTPGAASQGPAGDHFAALRGRPFIVPMLEPGGACPVAPEGREIAEEFARAVGPGPVYPVGLSWPGGATMYPWESAVTDDEWHVTKVLWVAAPGYDGPVLIRGRQIDGDRSFRFSGGTAGLATELRWADARAGVSGIPPTPSGFRQRPSHTYVRQPGCYAYQVDGDDFSYQIIVRVAERGEPMPSIDGSDHHLDPGKSP